MKIYIATTETHTCDDTFDAVPFATLEEAQEYAESVITTFYNEYGNDSKVDEDTSSTEYYAEDGCGNSCWVKITSHDIRM